MGNRSAGPKAIVSFDRCLESIPQADLNILNRNFRRFATTQTPNSNNNNNYSISREVFNREVTPRFDQFGETITARLFEVLDVDGDGFVNYEEYITAMYIFTYGNEDERLRLIFNMYDVGNSGYITKRELKLMASAILQAKAEPHARRRFEQNFNQLLTFYIDLVLRLYDTDRDQRLSFEEWQQFASDDEDAKEFLRAVALRP